MKEIVAWALFNAFAFSVGLFVGYHDGHNAGKSPMPSDERWVASVNLWMMFDARCTVWLDGPTTILEPSTVIEFRSANVICQPENKLN